MFPTEKDPDKIVELSDQLLSEIWTEYFPDTSVTSIFHRRTFIEGVKILTFRPEEKNTTLFLDGKGWNVKITANVLKVVTSTAILAATLPMMHFTDISPNILLSLLPNLFDLDRIEISPSDEIVLMELYPKGDKTRFMMPKELYEALPNELRADINYHGFINLLERLQSAGFASRESGKYMVFEEGKNRIRINWK